MGDGRRPARSVVAAGRPEVGDVRHRPHRARLLDVRGAGGRDPDRPDGQPAFRAPSATKTALHTRPTSRPTSSAARRRSSCARSRGSGRTRPRTARRSSSRTGTSSGPAPTTLRRPSAPRVIVDREKPIVTKSTAYPHHVRLELPGGRRLAGPVRGHRRVPVMRIRRRARQLLRRLRADAAPARAAHRDDRFHPRHRASS